MKSAVVAAILLMGSAVFAAPNNTTDSRINPQPSLTIKQRIAYNFKREDLGLYHNRHVISGIQHRTALNHNLGIDLKQLQAEAERYGYSSSIDITNYTTSVEIGGRPDTRTGSNLIFILHRDEAANKYEDEPLMFVASYDTPSTSNFVNDGSGVIALLTLAKTLISEMGSNNKVERVNITNSIVFAFTDTNVQKDSEISTHGAVSGAQQLTDSWLPTYLKGKTFRGAIVLDNVMNYQNADQSQSTAGSMDQAFPSAFKNIQSNGQRGNFLALVSRDDGYDSPLAKMFTESWELTRRTPKGPMIDARIVPFTFGRNTEVTPIYHHFIKSEQYQFWRSHTDSSKKLYPAILLTDTGNQYRPSPCGTACPVDAMTTDDNLEFLTRIVVTLRDIALKENTDSGAISGTQASMTAIILSMAIAVWWAQ